MTNNLLHGLSGIVLALPMAFALQHNTRLYGTEIETATAGTMHYNGWLHVVGGVTSDHKECTATDLEKSAFLASERRYTCDLYFEEFAPPASFSIRVSYNAREDADLIAAMDAVFLEGKYDQLSHIGNRVNYRAEVVALGHALEQFDAAEKDGRICKLRALPSEDNKMVVDTLVCR